MTAPNVQAILKWAKKNRSDISEDLLKRFIDNEAQFLLMAIAFEAGREFQHNNPQESFDFIAFEGLNFDY